MVIHRLAESPPTLYAELVDQEIPAAAIDAVPTDTAGRFLELVSS